MKEKVRITGKSIGAGIRRLRTIHGETQQELGAAVGYGATTIANYESGYRLPDVITFLQIIFRYGGRPEDFTDREVDAEEDLI